MNPQIKTKYNDEVAVAYKSQKVEVDRSQRDTAAKKSVFVETYGCQMNVYDTELVRSILSKAGYRFVDHESEADVVMLNTCSVRDNANRKVFNRVHAIKHGRGADNPVLVGVLGCMATNFRRKLLENPGLKIDFIAGPDSYKHLPRLINDVSDTGEKSFNITLSEFETYSDIQPKRNGGVNAWVAIMRGCNNYCTFCVVPHTRGRERSREPQNIVQEVERLVADGFKQVTLLGQNVNSYAYEGTDFADLIQMVSDVPGVERIRFTSPHPKDFPRKLFSIISERENVCKQVHMPLQSGNDRVLEKMNRTYTSQEFLDLIDEARSLIPNVSISTDIIVGFCSETAEEFNDTMNVVRKVRFDSAYMFKYSERPNTLASTRFKDDVPEDEKSRRLSELIACQNEITFAAHQAQIGSHQRAMIERHGSKKAPDDFVARNDGNTIVLLPSGPHQVGDILDVRIVSASPHALRAEVLC